MTFTENPDPSAANPPEEMIGDIPASIISSVLDRWGYEDRTETPEAPASETSESPDPKPATQPDNDPNREVNPVTPDNLPPGTPGTPTGPDAPSAPVDPNDNPDFVPPGGAIWQEGESGPDPATPPSVPNPENPPTPTTAPVVRLSDGTELTLSQVEAIIRAGANPSNIPPAPAPPNPAPFSGPLFNEEDLENPALRSVIMIAARQAEELKAVREQQEAIARSVRESEYRGNAEIVNSAVTSFRETHNLPEDLMHKVSEKASGLLSPHIEQQRRMGTLNPYEAVQNALIDAYWLVPEARQFEFERQAEQRNRALDRQRRLNGVGGSSGSAPRTAPTHDLSTPEGRHAAAVAEVASAMGQLEGNN